MRSSVISLARTFESELTLLHVMQPHPEHAGPYKTDTLGWEISRQEARAYLERWEREVALALGRPIDVRLEQGHPAARILGLAQELGADLTVLGSHGEGGVTAWNLGGTVQQVLAVTRGSVFVAHSSTAAAIGVPPRRILVPLDGSLRAESALPTATRIAAAYGAELVLVHVVQEPVMSAVLRAGDEHALATDLAARLAASAHDYLAGVRARLAHDDPDVRVVVVRHPNERQGLLEITLREHADLVVLAAHGVACDPARAFGSVTAYLLTHATVPLLVLQDLPQPRARPIELGERRAPPLRASYPPEVA